MARRALNPLATPWYPLNPTAAEFIPHHLKASGQAGGTRAADISFPAFGVPPPLAPARASHSRHRSSSASAHPSSRAAFLVGAGGQAGAHRGALNARACARRARGAGHCAGAQQGERCPAGAPAWPQRATQRGRTAALSARPRAQRRSLDQRRQLARRAANAAGRARRVVSKVPLAFSSSRSRHRAGLGRVLVLVTSTSTPLLSFQLLLPPLLLMRRPSSPRQPRPSPPGPSASACRA